MDSTGFQTTLTRPSIKLFDAALLQYAPARKLTADHPLESRGVAAIVSKVTGAAKGPTSSLPEVTIDTALWERLTDGEPALERVVQKELQPAWPEGMIDPPAFQELLDGKEPFSGLVVSIGINDADSSMWHSQGLMQSINGYIAGLLHENDFSCRTAYDEFVLVCGGELGAQSQRRLNHISERLWDFQLRGMNTCAILFSWGGVQVQNQPLAEAVASAVDRMRQTKRVPSPSRLASAHRAAV